MGLLPNFLRNSHREGTKRHDLYPAAPGQAPSKVLTDKQGNPRSAREIEQEHYTIFGRRGFPHTWVFNDFGPWSKPLARDLFPSNNGSQPGACVNDNHCPSETPACDQMTCYECRVDEHCDGAGKHFCAKAEPQVRGMRDTSPVRGRSTAFALLRKGEYLR